MRQTFKLGRLLGIPIGMHWSVLVIMALLAQGLAMTVLPAAAPGRPGIAYWLVAVVVAIVFLAGLLAHETAHAVVAQRFGVRVKRITLWLLGGVAELDGEAPHARGDLLIAASGPLTSLGLSVVCGLSTLAAGAAGASDLAISGLAWLAVVNLVLALFNMLPGAPLDGGRVLRAILWWTRGDRLAAQRISSRVGIGLGALMLAGGLVAIFTATDISGLWLMLLGWFLVSAARAEDIDAQLRQRLGGVKVADVMSPQPIHAMADQTVESFVTAVARYHPHRAYPVLDEDGRATGVVSVTRLNNVAVAQRSTVRLSDVQTPITSVATVDPKVPLAEVAAAVMAGGHRLSLVLSGGALVGVLSVTDISRALALVELGALPRRDDVLQPRS